MVYWGVPVAIVAIFLVFLLTGDLTRRDGSGVTVIGFPLIWQYWAWRGVCLRLGESRFYAFIASIWPISIFGTWRIAAVTSDQAHGGGLYGVSRAPARRVGHTGF